MKREEIISVLKDLHRITGFRVSLHGADYSEIAAYPESKCELCKAIQSRDGEYEKCKESDYLACKAAIGKREAQIYTCRYGMTEAVSPLYNFGTLTGFLMMGQVYDGEASREAGRRALVDMGFTDEAVSVPLASIPAVEPDMIPSYVKIMTICAQYLTVSHAIPSNKPSIAHLAKEYISLHFHTKTNINDICREIGCSKSALIVAFKKEYGTTVNAYTNEVRLTEALHLLRQGEHRIGDISEMCGFSDQSYFSKVFSMRYGVPPSDWESIDEGTDIFDSDGRREHQ